MATALPFCFKLTEMLSKAKNKNTLMFSPKRLIIYLKEVGLFAIISIYKMTKAIN